MGVITTTTTSVVIIIIIIIPIGSMYGIFTYIWSIFKVNVSKYTIHGSYGIIIIRYLFCISRIRKRVFQIPEKSVASAISNASSFLHGEAKKPKKNLKSRGPAKWCYSSYSIIISLLKLDLFQVIFFKNGFYHGIYHHGIHHQLGEYLFYIFSESGYAFFVALAWCLGVPYNPILWLKKIKHKPTHVEQIYTIYKWSFSSTQKSHFCCSISESQGFDGLNLEGRSLEDGTLVDVSRGSHPHLETPFI